MIPNKLRFEEIYLLSEVELFNAIKSCASENQMISVDIPTPIIAEPHSNLDLAYEYVNLLIFGETIAPYCEKISWEEVRADSRTVAVRFTLQPKDFMGLAKKLIWFSSMAKLMDNPEDLSWNPTNTDTSEYEALKYSFDEEFDKSVHFFPDLAESAVRNLIVGLREQYSGEELKEVYNELRVAYSRWWDDSIEQGSID